MFAVYTFERRVRLTGREVRDCSSQLDCCCTALKDQGSVFSTLPFTIYLRYGQRSADHEALDCELGEEMLSGGAKVADLWSVCTAEEAVGKFG